MGSIPGSGRYPQGGNGNPLQHSCLGNPMDRGAWWARGHKESDMTEWRRGRPGENIHCLNTYYLLGTRVVAVYFPHLSLFFQIFFMWTIFKVFIEFVIVMLLFYVLIFWQQGVQDLSSLTRNQTSTPCIGRRRLNHWTSKEVPSSFILTSPHEFGLICSILQMRKLRCLGHGI